MWNYAMNSKMRAADVKWKFKFLLLLKMFLFLKSNKSNSNICTHHGHNVDTDYVP